MSSKPCANSAKGQIWWLDDLNAVGRKEARAVTIFIKLGLSNRAWLTRISVLARVSVQDYLSVLARWTNKLIQSTVELECNKFLWTGKLSFL